MLNLPGRTSLLDVQIVNCQVCTEEPNQTRSTLHSCTSETPETASCSQTGLTGHTSIVSLRTQAKMAVRKRTSAESFFISDALPDASTKTAKFGAIQNFCTVLFYPPKPLLVFGIGFVEGSGIFYFLQNRV